MITNKNALAYFIPAPERAISTSVVMTTAFLSIHCGDTNDKNGEQKARFENLLDQSKVQSSRADELTAYLFLIRFVTLVGFECLNAQTMPWSGHPPITRSTSQTRK